MARLAGKVAIITGAKRGQGLAGARLFADEGATVVITDVDDATAEAGTIGATFLHHDVRDEDGWRHVVDQAIALHGRIDTLVNNAGVFRRGGLLDTTIDDYRMVTDINQLGTFLGMRAVAPQMIAQGTGSIVNIASIAGLRGAPAGFAYGASKWAITGMTRSAARSLAPHGIRVNSVHPGMIETGMMGDVTAGDAATHRRLADTVPLGGRHAAPEEIAPLVLFLASDESGYCTGAQFVADGGVMA